MARQNNQLVTPEARKALDQMKYEIAAELGLPVGNTMSSFGDTEFASELGSGMAGNQPSNYWGHIASRDAGAVGGTITRRLIQQAQETLLQSSSNS